MLHLICYPMQAINAILTLLSTPGSLGFSPPNFPYSWPLPSLKERDLILAPSWTIISFIQLPTLKLKGSPPGPPHCPAEMLPCEFACTKTNSHSQARLTGIATLGECLKRIHVWEILDEAVKCHSKMAYWYIEEDASLKENNIHKIHIYSTKEKWNLKTQTRTHT